ncbi:MAG: hypothetical protein JWR61_4216 [Ferruginibacter sp.]|nr:hypothetical protein [Ferruginibacter sp.]
MKQSKRQLRLSGYSLHKLKRSDNTIGFHLLDQMDMQILVLQFLRCKIQKVL